MWKHYTKSFCTVSMKYNSSKKNDAMKRSVWICLIKSTGSGLVHLNYFFIALCLLHDIKEVVILVKKTFSKALSCCSWMIMCAKVRLKKYQYVFNTFKIVLAWQSMWKGTDSFPRSKDFVWSLLSNFKNCSHTQEKFTRNCSFSQYFRSTRVRPFIWFCVTVKNHWTRNLGCGQVRRGLWYCQWR